VTEHGLWFIREGAEHEQLGKWEVWFRPLHHPQRKHGNFLTRDQALEVVTALNELSRRGPRPDADAERSQA
jgi:hypothetical protein